MTQLSRFGLIALCLTVWLGAAMPGTASASPSEFIRHLGDQAVSVLRSPGTNIDQREARFRQLLASGFDMNFIGRFVMGRYWNRATPEQRGDYLNLFNEYILRTYSARFGGYAGETLNVVTERPAGKQDVLVSTRIERPSGPPINADWRIRVIDGQYKIIDVMVEGISMAITQKSEFSTVIQRNGIDGLIEILRARTDKMGATASVQ